MTAVELYNYQRMTHAERVQYHNENGELLADKRDEYEELVMHWFHMEGYDYETDFEQRPRAHDYAVQELRFKSGLKPLYID